MPKAERENNSVNPNGFVIREMPGGKGALLVRKSDVPALDKRMSIANQVMIDRGFDPAKPGDIPIEDVLKMREEIQKRMTESNG